MTSTSSWVRFMGALATVGLMTASGMACSGDENTPATDTMRAAVDLQAPPADRKYLLERVDEAAVAQLYADGFAALPLDQKTLIWHLYEAAPAGGDLYYDQRDA